MNSQALIKVLPEHVVNQIKAGEVIERPANIIKEVLENSLDAGSTKIDLVIKEEGLKQIIIQDNGHGMSFDNLPLAFQRHATSKISDFNHIYGLESFGFRGEALASISSVSKIKCLSTSNKKTSLFEMSAGEVIVHQSLETTQQQGTQLFISDLFFNTPVRLKFNQSRRSEKRQIEKVIKIFLLSHPHVQLSITWDNEDKKIYQATTLQKRCQQLFYKTIKNKEYPQLFELNVEYENFQIKGFLSKDSSTGYSSKEQFFFINDRYFEEKKFHNLICRQMEHTWYDRSQGHYVLFIETAPHLIDVNIHPRKTQIKFQQASTLYSFLSESIKNLRTQNDKANEAQSLEQKYHHIPNNFSNHFLGQKNSFFSQDSQYFSSKDLKKDFQYSPEFSGLHQESSLPLTTWSHIQNFKNRYLLISSPQSHFYILDSYLLASYLLKQSQYYKAENKVPLLVSEMINDQNYSDQDIKKLAQAGFVLEKVQEKQYALRAVPKFILNFRYQRFLSQLLELFIHNQNINFTSIPFSSLSFILKDFDESLPAYLSTKILISFEQASWERLWE